MALTPYTDDMETWLREFGMFPTAHFLPTLRERVKAYQWVCESLFEGNTTPCLDWNQCLNKSSSYIEVVKVLHVIAHKHLNPVPPEKLGYFMRTKWEPIGENINELVRFATPFSKDTKVEVFAKDIKNIVDNMRKDVCDEFVNPLTPWTVSNKVLNALDQIRQLYDEFLQMQEEIKLPTNAGYISILKTLELMTPGAIAANLQAMIECVRKHMSMGYLEQYFVDAAETPNLSQGLRCSKTYASIPLSVRNHCGGISKKNGRYQGVSFANKKDANMGFRARTTEGSTIYLFKDEQVAATATAFSRKYGHTPKDSMNFMAYILSDNQ